jgi:diadenosine tetraphosphate (Ap4A) HIT family hydrolase
MDCYVCSLVAGERRISPGATIHDGAHWMVEHAYPTSHPGWLVIVLKRHAEALHELTVAELAELGALQARTVRALAAVLGSQKEYIACYSEGEHFYHIHVHVVARPADLPPEHRGPHSFHLLAVSPEQALPPERVRALCATLAAWFLAGLAATAPA